jgi:hypothetical protein
LKKGEMEEEEVVVDVGRAAHPEDWKYLRSRTDSTVAPSASQ